MHIRFTALGAALVAATLASSASAHGIAGKRLFPTTLTIDDPAVADEVSLPTVQHTHMGASDDGPAILRLAA